MPFVSRRVSNRQHRPWGIVGLQDGIYTSFWRSPQDPVRFNRWFGAVDYTANFVRNNVADLNTTAITTKWTLSAKWFGGLLMTDGRVFMPHFGLPYATIYNPEDGSYFNTPNIAGNYIGCCLLRDGRVLLAPYSGSDRICIYDPKTNSWFTSSVSITGTFIFISASMLPDGRVYCMASGFIAQSRIYDPATDTAVLAAGTILTSEFSACTLLPNGKVYLIPYAGAGPKLYDPVADTLTASAGVYSNSEGWFGSVWLPDGRLFVCPHGSTTARIYDWRTDTVTTPGGTYPGGRAFYSGTLMLDGRVYLAPYNTAQARIYDPVLDTVITPPGTAADFNKFSGCVTLPDGRVFSVPYLTSSEAIYSGRVIPVSKNFSLNNAQNSRI